MATVTGYTAARMKAIEDAAIIDGDVVGNDLILTRFNMTQINAGNVRGAQGAQGATGVGGILVVTSTTRPAAPYNGQMIYETDTTRMYLWNGTVWVYRGGIIVCTSTTRPTSPIYGQAIIESDTSYMYIWNGQTWSLPKNIAGGQIGTPAVVTVDQQGIVAETQLTNATTTVNVGANRRIKLSFQAIVTRTIVDGYISLKIKEGSNLICSFPHATMFANIGSSTTGFCLLAPSAGIHTYFLTLERTSGTGTAGIYASVTNPTCLVVEDIGGV